MIDKAINRILDQPLILCAEANNTRGIYSVRIGTLKTDILIMLTPSAEKYGHFEIKVSHTIKTPLQAKPYRQKWRRGSSQVDALRRALHYLIEHYRQLRNVWNAPAAQFDLNKYRVF